MLHTAPSAFRVDPAPHVPISALAQGKPCAEVAELLPRLFNLCRTAQEIAGRRAMGLPSTEDTNALRREIIRDHVLKLSLVLPGHFGQAPPVLPAGWQEGSAPLRQALFGPSGDLPHTSDDLEGYLSGGSSLGGLWRRVKEMFPKGEAVSGPLPEVDDRTACDPKAAVENSSALRVACHPFVAGVEAQFGRGPLWRVIARSYDLEAQLNEWPLAIRSPRPGTAHVPATRGLYTVQVEVAEGRVRALSRVTPTDHLCAPGGMLARTLATLPAHRGGLVPLLMDIMDPCTPLRVREVSDA